MPTPITPPSPNTLAVCPSKSCWKTPQTLGFVVAAIVLAAFAAHGFSASGVALNTKLILPLTLSALAGGCLLGAAHHIFKNKGFAHAGAMTFFLGVSLICVGVAALAGSHILPFEQSGVAGFSLAAGGFGLMSLCFYSLSAEEKQNKGVVDNPKELPKQPPEDSSVQAAIPLQPFLDALFTQDDEGNTPLHRAVINKDREAYQYWTLIGRHLGCLEQVRAIPNQAGLTIQRRIKP